MQEQVSERPSLYTAEQYPMHRHVVSVFQFMDHAAVNARVHVSLLALPGEDTLRGGTGGPRNPVLTHLTAGFPSVCVMGVVHGPAAPPPSVHLSPAPSSGKGVGCLCLSAKSLNLAEGG